MKHVKAIGYALALSGTLALLAWLRWYEARGGAEAYREAARPAQVGCEHWYIGWDAR